MSLPSSTSTLIATQMAKRLVGFYPKIQASDPAIYIAGLVQLFSHYPETIVSEAIDAVAGLPAESEFLPTIAHVKAFLEPRFQHWLKMERLRNFGNKPDQIEGPPPEQRPTYGQLQAKYGKDWGLAMEKPLPKLAPSWDQIVAAYQTDPSRLERLLKTDVRDEP